MNTDTALFVVVLVIWLVGLVVAWVVMTETDDAQEARRAAGQYLRFLDMLRHIRWMLRTRNR